MTRPSVNHAQSVHSRRVIRWLLSRDAQMARTPSTRGTALTAGASNGPSTAGDGFAGEAGPEMLDAVAGSEFIDDRMRLRE